MWVQLHSYLNPILGHILNEALRMDPYDAVITVYEHTRKNLAAFWDQNIANKQVRLISR